MFDIDEYFSNLYKNVNDINLVMMQNLMNRFDNFEKKMKFIHIAGTNGKGSCTEIISNILVKQGYKVGKYISPHLIKYNERICINGKEISDKEIIGLINELNPIIKEYDNKVTCFELITTMALLYFYRNNVDFVVLETGLGGIRDCTNIISKPLVSIITSIGYDHMHILGNTLTEIAENKAGIIKDDSNTVIFEDIPDVENVFISKCKKHNNILHIIKEKDIHNYKYDNMLQYFEYKDFKDLAINLKGKVQIKNACMCIETIDILRNLGYEISDESIRNGLKTVIHKARMECLNDKPVIMYDGAHNEPAIKNLQDMVKMYFDNKKRVYIISILKRKDYKKMLELLAEDKNACFVLTSGNNLEKFATSDELYEIMKNYTSTENILKKDLDIAIEDVLSENEDDVNLVVGSFYVYGDVVKKINEIKEIN